MKIKLFVDAHVFDNSFQGTATYLRGLYSALINDKDFDITLAAQDTEKLKKIFPDPAFKFVSLPPESKFKRLAYDIPKIIRENGYDYAHFQYIIPLKKECKYINTIHDLLFLDFPSYFPLSYRFTKKILFQLSAIRSDMICTVSEYSRQALIKHFKISDDKITITSNAIDLNVHQPIDVKKKYGLNKYILFVSRVEPRKNHLLLLKAFIELGLYNQDYKLVFIGRQKDVETKKYSVYLNSLPVHILKHIIQLENISNEELSSFYKQAELFVYPSVAEGFGIPPLEAGISGCRVLCSDQTAMKDFDFFGPYLFDPSNEKEFRSKLLSTLIDKNYPYQEIKNAIVSKFNWKSISEVFAQKIKQDFKG